MRPLLRFLLVFVAVFAVGLAALVVWLPGHGEHAALAQKRQTEAVLIQMLELQAEEWNRGDIEAFMQSYWRSPKLTFAGSGGVERGWDGVLTRYKRVYPDRSAMGHLEFSELEITPLGSDAALVLGHWQLQREKDQPGGVFTLVLRRFPNGWRIIHDHTSAVTPIQPRVAGAEPAAHKEQSRKKTATQTCAVWMIGRVVSAGKGQLGRAQSDGGEGEDTEAAAPHARLENPDHSRPRCRAQGQGPREMRDTPRSGSVAGR